jgi:phytoene dehydrogenase-like protein
LQGTTNLLTRALATVGKKMETLPDPAMVHYHLPDGLDVRVHRDYEEFIAELTSKFPHEKEGIRKFYDDCWKVGRPKRDDEHPVREYRGCVGVAKSQAHGIRSGTTKDVISSS